MHVGDALFKHCRISWYIKVDEQRSRLQVQVGIFGIGGKKNAAVRIVVELIE